MAYVPAKATAGGWSTKKKNKRFAELYVIECGYNATAAYKRLWQEINPDKDISEMPSMNTVRTKGYAYRHKEPVKKEIERIEKAIEESQVIRRNEVVFSLREIAFSEDSSNSDKLRALDLLNKMGGFYTENLNVKGSQDITVSLVD